MIQIQIQVLNINSYMIFKTSRLYFYICIIRWHSCWCLVWYSWIKGFDMCSHACLGSTSGNVLHCSFSVNYNISSMVKKQWTFYGHNGFVVLFIQVNNGISGFTCWEIEHAEIYKKKHKLFCCCNAVFTFYVKVCFLFYPVVHVRSACKDFVFSEHR